jgi:hypothetical protein
MGMLDKDPARRPSAVRSMALGIDRATAPKNSGRRLACCGGGCALRAPRYFYSANDSRRKNRDPVDFPSQRELGYRRGGIGRRKDSGFRRVRGSIFSAG